MNILFNEASLNVVVLSTGIRWSRSASPPCHVISTLPSCASRKLPESAPRASSASRRERLCAMSAGISSRAGLNASGISTPSSCKVLSRGLLAGSMATVISTPRSLDVPRTMAATVSGVCTVLVSTSNEPKVSRISRYRCAVWSIP
ncbi:hypothetical protein D3C71_1352400 [compost metagenome]